MIKGHLSAKKMLEKSIKDHPIVVGAYTKYFVSNSGIKEGMDAKVMATKLKENLVELYFSSASSSKSINELNISVASTEMAEDTSIRKL